MCPPSYYYSGFMATDALGHQSAIFKESFVILKIYFEYLTSSKE